MGDEVWPDEKAFGLWSDEYVSPPLPIERAMGSRVFRETFKGFLGTAPPLYQFIKRIAIVFRDGLGSIACTSIDSPVLCHIWGCLISWHVDHAGKTVAGERHNLREQQRHGIDMVANGIPNNRDWIVTLLRQESVDADRDVVLVCLHANEVPATVGVGEGSDTLCNLGRGWQLALVLDVVSLSDALGYEGREISLLEAFRRIFGEGSVCHTSSGERAGHRMIRRTPLARAA